MKKFEFDDLKPDHDLDELGIGCFLFFFLFVMLIGLAALIDAYVKSR